MTPVVEFFEEGWVRFRRHYCKEGHLDVWNGDQSCDPNKLEKANYNLNMGVTYLRCNTGDWYNVKELNIKGHFLEYMDLITEFTADEIWKEFIFKKIK
jgi:hypothetical protein